MAAFDVTNSLRTIEKVLKTSGRYALVRIGEPKQPPITGQGIAAAVYMESSSVVGTTLTNPIEVHTVSVRFYRAVLDQPEDKAEIDLANAVADFEADLDGDYTLGGAVRNIDVAGQHGGGLSAAWGYVEIGGTMFRTAAVTVPLIVDPDVAFVA